VTISEALLKRCRQAMAVLKDDRIHIIDQSMGKEAMLWLAEHRHGGSAIRFPASRNCCRGAASPP